MTVRSISIKDVARRAGVSPTTVSRVLNNSAHPVNSKTRRRVKAAIAELNFHPNRLAQGLINNKSHLIGVIVHDLSDPYFAEMVKGMERVIIKYDYIVNIYNTSRDVDKELKAVDLLRANRAEAVVLTGGTLLDQHYRKEMAGYIKELQSNGTIVLGVTAHPFNIKSIELGNSLAARLITNYLLEQGHRAIAYINGPAILGTTNERWQGFQEALLARKIPIRDKWIVAGDFSFEGGRRAARQLLDEITGLTAVVASNDEMALGVMWEFKNQGLAIPDDLSVVGIGNIPAAKYAYPPLTTIALPIFDLGVQIGEYLINTLADKGSFNDQPEVQLSLVERDSVRSLLEV